MSRRGWRLGVRTKTGRSARKAALRGRGVEDCAFIFFANSFLGVLSAAVATPGDGPDWVALLPPAVVSSAPARFLAIGFTPTCRHTTAEAEEPTRSGSFPLS